MPIDSKVLRPMTTTWPVVIFLNHLKSSGKCHGILFPCPMTRFSLIAAMALKYFTALDGLSPLPSFSALSAVHTATAALICGCGS